MFQQMPKSMKQHISGKWTHDALCAAVRDAEMYSTSERQNVELFTITATNIINNTFF